MDVLSEILAQIRLKGTLYFRTHFNPPWGVRVPNYSNVARFHLAVRGQCQIAVHGQGTPVILEPGDLIVIPHGSEHILRDGADSPVQSVDQVVSEAGFTGQGALVYGGPDQGHATSLICGHFEFDDEARHPLLEALPSYICIRGSENLDYLWLESAMKFIGHEVGSDKPGCNAIAIKLSEIIFIQILRAFAEQSGQQTGIFAAIGEPQIGRALAAIHREPGARWTLESLAKEAGLSRTTFAERFHRSMGLTPLQYLTQWRMERARTILVEEKLSMIEVAERVGYQSEAAFTRVFKKTYDVGPATYRRQKASLVSQAS